MKVYQIDSVHLIRHATRATFPVRGRLLKPSVSGDQMKFDQISSFLESPSQPNRLTAPFDKGANQMPPLSKGGGPSVRTVVGFKERRTSFYMIFIRII